MAEELEIKLTLTDEALERALAWLRSQQEASLGPVKTLVNIYYDTRDAALNGQRAALRVRQAGDRYIQTLKTQGDFVGGAIGARSGSGRCLRQTLIWFCWPIRLWLIALTLPTFGRYSKPTSNARL
ncbi:CYTH domain-containing protein [Marinobacter similis]|uniref:CYTH domain-containing protein n=1 Tax=Marinobacter similis TaxID=1420916 RepID=UPI0022A9CC3C|nr:CYTH domain-containing protein [Marinobacter similis]